MFPNFSGSDIHGCESDAHNSGSDEHYFISAIFALNFAVLFDDTIL